ncbi:MAG TPA: hypothetical protein VI636_09605 [Candidatus Angelobacter sp.]
MTNRKWIVAIAIGAAMWASGRASAQNFQNDGPAVKNKAQYAVPIPMGTSGFNIAKGDCATGTLGSLVQDADGLKYILSNNHVLALANQGNKNVDPIKHVGTLDTAGCAGLGTLAVATLTQFQPIDFVNPNMVDAAIAKINTGSAKADIVAIPGFNPATEVPVLNRVVIKSGRTSGVTKGTISAVNVTINVNYVVNGVVKVAQFTNQIAITPVIPVAFFSQPGDSGSLIFQCDTTDKNWHPVGLLFAGGLVQQVNNGWVFIINTTFGNTLQNVTTAFHNLGVDLTFVAPSAASPDCTAVAAATMAQAIPAGAPDVNNLQEEFLRTPQGVAALASANAVKDHYNQFLTTQEGVIGAGVGFSDKGTEQIVIKVFVRSDAGPGTLSKLPKVLDGVVVEAVVAPPTIIAL